MPTPPIKEIEVLAEIAAHDYVTRIRIVEVGRGTFVDVRKFYLGECDEWLPSPKGIMLGAAVIDTTITALHAAKSRLGAE